MRYVTSRLQKVRAEAAIRSNNVAVRFTRDAGGYLPFSLSASLHDALNRDPSFSVHEVDRGIEIAFDVHFQAVVHQQIERG